MKLKREKELNDESKNDEEEKEKIMMVILTSIRRKKKKNPVMMKLKLKKLIGMKIIRKESTPILNFLKKKMMIRRINHKRI
jgi:hypothetical protein